MKKHIIISIITIVLLYSCWAFVLMTINASNWTEDARGGYIVTLVWCEFAANVFTFLKPSNPQP